MKTEKVSQPKTKVAKGSTRIFRKREMRQKVGREEGRKAVRARQGYPPREQIVVRFAK